MGKRKNPVPKNEKKGEKRISRQHTPRRCKESGGVRELPVFTGMRFCLCSVSLHQRLAAEEVVSAWSALERDERQSHSSPH